MFRTFSFFSGFTVEQLKESEFIDKIADIYHVSMGGLVEQEAKLDFELDHVWNGEIWKLAEPELKHGDRMKFGEFIDSKQIVQNMVALGRNHWECLIPLAAIFLRREGEEYEEAFLYDGSDRQKLMESLPLDIALQVGFFLSGSLNMCIKAFLSSSQPGLKPAAGTLTSILRTSGG